MIVFLEKMYFYLIVSVCTDEEMQRFEFLYFFQNTLRLLDLHKHHVGYFNITARFAILFNLVQTAIRFSFIVC